MYDSCLFDGAIAIDETFQKCKLERLITFCAKSITGILVGGIGYTVILQFHLWVCGVKMSGYQGGSSYSILNSICSLPASLYKMYQLFWLYFKGVLFRINRMQGKQIFTLMFILASVLAVICFVRIFKKADCGQSYLER